MTKSKNGMLIALVGFLAYLILGTGLHGDDFAIIAQFADWSFEDWIIPDPAQQGIFILTFPSYVSFFWVYWLFGSNFDYVYDLIKIIMHIFFLWCSYKFFKDYLSNDRAIIAAIIFILSPIHDATIYWYMCLPYLFSTSLILLSHQLIRSNFLKSGFLICLLGAFSFYSSPPYILGLSVLFLFNREYKKFFTFLLPGFLYIAFYISIKALTSGVERRVNSELEIIDVIRNFFLQLITMLDSFFGPSFFLKIWSSIQSISVLGFFISVFLCAYAARFLKNLSTPSSINRHLLLSIVIVTIISFGMYSITGLYNHSPFNLGNRSMLYGSLLFAVLFASYIPAKRIGILILLIFFILPSVGLSEHWKEWNQVQKKITHQIKQTISLNKIPADSLIFVKGNLYSKLGSYSHIEFLIMPWTLKALSPQNIEMIALTNYLEINKNKILIDKKWGHSINLPIKLFLYDSSKDLLLEISAEELALELGNQPKLLRHWIQFLEGTAAHDILISIYPRIDYIF